MSAFDLIQDELAKLNEELKPTDPTTIETFGEQTLKSKPRNASKASHGSLPRTKLKKKGSQNSL